MDADKTTEKVNALGRAVYNADDKAKLDTLSKKFDIPVTEKLEGEVNEMCNYSDYIEKKAREKDDLTHIQNLMQTTGWSADEAMNALKVDPDKRDSYKDIISGKKPAMA